MVSDVWNVGMVQGCIGYLCKYMVVAATLRALPVVAVDDLRRCLLEKFVGMVAEIVLVPPVYSLR